VTWEAQNSQDFSYGPFSRRPSEISLTSPSKIRDFTGNAGKKAVLREITTRR
jgi:hypothetical protein